MYPNKRAITKTNPWFDASTKNPQAMAPNPNAKAPKIKGLNFEIPPLIKVADPASSKTKG